MDRENRCGMIFMLGGFCGSRPVLFGGPGWTRTNDKKFVWEVGKQNMPCNPPHFARQFKLAIERAEGVRVLTPHCCRHTFVSMMQMLGVDIETIQNIAGHAEVDMTLHYLHVQEPRRQEAARRFSEAFSKKGGGVYGNVLDYKKSS